MQIKLSKIQFEYLRSCLLLERKDLATYFDFENIKETNFVQIPDDSVDDIRDWAADRLQKVGFDVNYSLTHEGLILDGLIDLFYI